MNNLFVFLLAVEGFLCQIRVDDYFFDVTVTPPDSSENTVYDDTISSIDAEPKNVSSQQIKEFYETENAIKWKQEIKKLQPVYEPGNDHSFKVFEPPEEQTVKPHIVPKLILMKEFPKPEAPPLRQIEIQRDPIITMEMTSLNVVSLLKEAEVITPEHKISNNTPLHNGEVADNNRIVQLEQNLEKLRNEVHLLKGLLNKLYKKMYARKFFEEGPRPESWTRISAVQENQQWKPIRFQRTKHTSVKKTKFTN